MYLSISYAIRDERHIRILFLIEKLPTFGRNLALNCADIIFLLYSLAVFYFGFYVVNRSLDLGQIAPATELPVAVLYASVVVGSALNVVRLVLRMHKRAIALNESATLRAIEK
jgi:TRAP-type C4-dicarboxylate transport system permease small subunit